MSGDFSLNLSKMIIKIMKILFLFISIYCVTVFITGIIVATHTDKGFMLKMYARERINECDPKYKTLEYGVFYPVGFYINKNYWFADYKVSLPSFSGEKCAMDIFNEMKKYDKYVTVAVVDENSKVIFYIKNFK